MPPKKARIEKEPDSEQAPEKEEKSKQNDEDSSDDDDFGPMPVAEGGEGNGGEGEGEVGGEGQKRKKKRTLEFESVFLGNLPSAEQYEVSYMHRDVVTHVAVSKSAEFLITGSADGERFVVIAVLRQGPRRGMC